MSASKNVRRIECQEQSQKATRTNEPTDIVAQPRRRGRRGKRQYVVLESPFRDDTDYISMMRNLRQ